MPGTTADNKTNAAKLYEVISSGQAPAQIGKPIFEKDLEIAKMCGATDLADIFGHVEKSDNVRVGDSLNFGSRKSTGMMPDDVRIRLFQLKKMVSDVEIQASYLFKTNRPSADQMMSTPMYKKMLEPTLKAFNITDFSTWIPNVNSRFYFEEYEVPRLLADQFDEMPMESATVTTNGALGRLFGQLETDVATFAIQSNTSANYVVNAKNNVVHTQITEDLNQDSAPAVIEKFRKEVLAGIGRSEERSLLDGDDSIAHMDADVVAATDFRKAFKGLRKRALDNSANGVVYDHSGAVADKPLFAELLKRIGKASSDKADLCWLVGTSIDTQVVTGAIPELFTWYNVGQPAPNVTGQFPAIFGIKGVASEFVREDLAATGLYTVPAETKTWLGLVKKSRFSRHLRAAVRVWAAPSLPSSDLMLMSAKKRHTFGGVPQSATEKAIAIAINIETV